jgi:hypothetical protein
VVVVVVVVVRGGVVMTVMVAVLVLVVLVLVLLLTARARVDDAAEDALVLRVGVAAAKVGEVVAHALGGLAVLEELGRGAPLGGVGEDRVARGGPFHGRGGGAGWVRGVKAGERGGASLEGMGVVKGRVAV